MRACSSTPPARTMRSMSAWWRTTCAPRSRMPRCCTRSSCCPRDDLAAIHDGAHGARRGARARRLAHRAQRRGWPDRARAAPDRAHRRGRRAHSPRPLAQRPGAHRPAAVPARERRAAARRGACGRRGARDARPARGGHRAARLHAHAAGHAELGAAVGRGFRGGDSRRRRGARARCCAASTRTRWDRRPATARRGSRSIARRPAPSSASRACSNR